ncbi:MAG: ABC transporter ATP-binding protein [Lachnospiraceae bacterium]|nr:ABC transporter ATP-binding protein [Lachnospiraceae bacterium]
MKNIIMCYVKPYFPQMGVGFLIKFTGTIMDLCIPYILAHIIDVIIPTGQKKLIFFWGLAMMICSGLAVTGNMIANRRASLVSSRVTRTLRHDLFSKIMYLSNRQMDDFTKPSLISRMTSDTYDLQQVIARIQRLGVRAPILLIGGIFVTFTLDWAMALVLTATLPLLAMLTVFVSKKGIPIYAKLQEANDRMVRVVREDIAGIRVIKALSKTGYETEKFRKVNSEVIDREKKAGMVMAVMNPAMTILLNLGLVCVIITGAYRVQSGACEVGKILAFTTYFTIILNAMMSISKMFSMISKSIASGNRIWKVLNSESEMEVMEELERAENESAVAWTAADRSMAEKEAAQPVEILFDHVTFSYYKGQEPSLRDISFRVRKGETLGIIGEIGSGKSTVLALLMRLYDADSGRIFVGGQDVRSQTPEQLKKKFGVVFQNDMIFEDTIAGNVTLGRELSQEQIQEALLYAQASEFVQGRDSKEADALNIRGANLSGGQKQRVLIARALAMGPEILILDDSSSALDYGTDAKLRQGIREHFSNTTLVIVAQRISSIRHADHILVLEEGNMIGYGTHEQLMESCEVYREISHSQMGEGSDE